MTQQWQRRLLLLCRCVQVDAVWYHFNHYIDVIMTTMASQITSLTVVYSTVYSGADQRKHQNSASLAFVWGIHRDRWIPRTKGQLRGKCFHLMTSSWMRLIVCVHMRVQYLLLCILFHMLLYTGKDVPNDFFMVLLTIHSIAMYAIKGILDLN